MKAFFAFCFCLYSVFSFGQIVDSTALRQVDSLITVLRQLLPQGKYEEAEQVGETLQNLAEDAFGTENATYARCLYSRGKVYYSERKYKEAEQLYLEAKAIRERVLGKDNEDYLQSVRNLAYLYHYMKRYEAAEQLYIETKDIQLKLSSGKEDVEYAIIITNLAVLYHEMGLYEDAEPLYLKALAIFGNLDDEKIRYSQCLNNIGALYFFMGSYDVSERSYLKANKIKGNALGKDHREYATGLNNLALLYAETGRYEEAERVHLEALHLREKILDKTDPEYMQSLNNLGELYEITKRYKDAESMYIQARDITQKSEATESPEYAAILNNLANVYYKTGQYGKSDTLYLESKNIRLRMLGPRHSDYAQSLINLGLLQCKLGDYKAAESYYQEANTVTNARLSNACSFFTDRELSAYIQLFSKDLDHYYSLAQKDPEALIGFSARCYNNILFHKGFLLNASSSIRNLAASDTAAIRLNNLLKSYHRLLAKGYADLMAKQIDVAALEEKANTTEKELVRRVAGFDEAVKQVNWQEVRAALKPGEAAIEFIHYRYYSPDPTDSVQYAALVLRQGDAQPVMVSLFEARQLASLIPEINDLDRIDEFYNFKTGSSVYNLIWKPLAQLLKGVATVYCAPSGLLHRLNLGAIPIPPSTGGRGLTISDRHRLVVLGSTRQLIHLKEAMSPKALTAALFGGIQYDSDSSEVAASFLRDTTGQNDLGTNASDNAFPYELATRGGSARPWKPLPGTASEVQKIATLLQKHGFKTQIETNAVATEENFGQLGRTPPSPRMLHLATHGYAFPDPKEVPHFKRGLGESQLVFKLSDNPMIRSGLILAGANTAWVTGHPPAQREDGILTAYEISQMNLSNTELVVLSACETGLGQIEGNEGVYGLQRAFKIAGAKYLIMSLWQVNDQKTGELMIEFYHQYLDRKLSVPEAFRMAQQKMRKKYPYSPYVWAAFVLIE
ncbi:MAG: CHAT domain-containing protein [Phycisphaerae bacterium]|nr:CHAT domain-containing protein [Saprospiraceae bacterium]